MKTGTCVTQVTYNYIVPFHGQIMFCKVIVTIDIRNFINSHAMIEGLRNLSSDCVFTRTSKNLQVMYTLHILSDSNGP